MSAVVPGGPKTSYTTCFGSKVLLSFTLVSAYEGRFSEPKMPCNRDTVKPPAPITTSMTSGIHNRFRTPERPRTPKIANPLRPFSLPGAIQPLAPANYSSAATHQTAAPRTRWTAQCGRAVVTVTEWRPRKRDPIVKSKPCGWLRYRILPNAISDCNA